MPLPTILSSFGECFLTRNTKFLSPQKSSNWKARILFKWSPAVSFTSAGLKTVKSTDGEPPNTPSLDSLDKTHMSQDSFPSTKKSKWSPQETGTQYLPTTQVTCMQLDIISMEPVVMELSKILQSLPKASLVKKLPKLLPGMEFHWWLQTKVNFFHVVIDKDMATNQLIIFLYPFVSKQMQKETYFKFPALVRYVN